MSEKQEKIKKNDLPEAVNLAKDKGIKIIKLSNSDGDFYIKKPQKEEIKQLLDAAGRDRTKFSALMENQIKRSMLYPTLEEFEKILAEKPGLFASLYGEVLSYTGLNEDFLSEEI